MREGPGGFLPGPSAKLRREFVNVTPRLLREGLGQSRNSRRQRPKRSIRREAIKSPAAAQGGTPHGARDCPQQGAKHRGG